MKNIYLFGILQIFLKLYDHILVCILHILYDNTFGWYTFAILYKYVLFFSFLVKNIKKDQHLLDNALVAT